jgi:hypothetical protein
MPAGAHQALRIVTRRRPATAQERMAGTLPSIRRGRAWTQSLHWLPQVDLALGRA